jgi:hypothetical protein
VAEVKEALPQQVGQQEGEEELAPRVHGTCFRALCSCPSCGHSSQAGDLFLRIFAHLLVVGEVEEEIVHWATLGLTEAQAWATCTLLQSSQAESWFPTFEVE